MYSKSPCKDCTERTAECHATCERFLLWDQAHRQKRDEEYRRRGVDLEYGKQVARRQLERMKHKFRP